MAVLIFAVYDPGLNLTQTGAFCLSVEIDALTLESLGETVCSVDRYPDLYGGDRMIAKSECL
jgi:hypothetical protein